MPITFTKKFLLTNKEKFRVVVSRQSMKVLIRVQTTLQMPLISYIGFIAGYFSLVFCLEILSGLQCIEPLHSKNPILVIIFHWTCGKLRPFGTNLNFRWKTVWLPNFCYKSFTRNHPLVRNGRCWYYCST